MIEKNDHSYPEKYIPLSEWKKHYKFPTLENLERIIHYSSKKDGRCKEFCKVDYFTNQVFINARRFIEYVESEFKVAADDLIRNWAL